MRQTSWRCARATFFKSLPCLTSHSLSASLPVPRGVAPQAADGGSTQEMNYLEFVEGVARVALQLYLNTLPEDQRDQVDYKSADVSAALKDQLEFLTAHVQELVNSGTIS